MHLILSRRFVELSDKIEQIGLLTFERVSAKVRQSGKTLMKI